MSGLDDVVLLNGFVRHETEYGDGVSIDHVDNLHLAIALHILTTKKALSPKEFRFLRGELELTQDALGDLIGVDGQTVARYEKGSTPISGPADRLIRVFFVINLMPEDQMKNLLSEMKDAIKQDELDQKEPARFRENHGKWEEAYCG
ncbi:helix-turn-helix domain-containing protein [Cypionkella sinensis]|uniref:Helix-turn-helix domain-containing protein n=2 Tax=Cypionkella sinensis TaxID=1756043 RepID=A0ABV7IWN8_9RHOB